MVVRWASGWCLLPMVVSNMTNLHELETEALRLLKFGRKMNQYPSAESKEWDQAYGIGMATCAESILTIINRIKVDEEIKKSRAEE